MFQLTVDESASTRTGVPDVPPVFVVAAVEDKEWAEAETWIFDPSDEDVVVLLFWAAAVLSFLALLALSPFLLLDEEADDELSFFFLMDFLELTQTE